MSNHVKWWQKAVFYQIYPRSFADGNGDGIGDFQGMIQKLDYLQQLGIDAIWLSPHYPSPYVDCGYDISDYRGVAEEYGNLSIFKEFLDGLHKRGIKLVLDLVLNHTSDQHPWFLESRSSKNNSKRDWYIWRRGVEDQKPNDWYSTFGGSAWEYDSLTQEYYYHYFFKEQPDLNWKNPEVQKAMFDEVRFWLDMGVDGFRLDAVGTIFENDIHTPTECNMTQEQLFELSRKATTAKDHENVVKAFMQMFKDQVDQPEVHQITKDLRKLVDEYEDRVLIGETDDISFYGNNDELHLNFNFPLMRTNHLTAEHVRRNQRERLSKLPKGAWPCNTLGNHDSSRVYSNFGDGKNHELQARLYLLLLLTMKGTPFLYNGEEIGMSDYLILDRSTFKDPLCELYYDLEKRVMGSSEEIALKVGASRGRDRCRTPLQWSNTENAGFSPKGVKTWLPVNPDYQNGFNVEDQNRFDGSLLNYYRKLIKIRHETPALQFGEYLEILTDNTSVLVFTRSTENNKVLAVLNLNKSEENVQVDSDLLSELTCIFNTGTIAKVDHNRVIHLLPYQGMLFE